MKVYMCMPATTTKNIDIKFKMYACMRACVRASTYVCVCIFGVLLGLNSKRMLFYILKLVIFQSLLVHLIFLLYATLQNQG